ncbi:MAG: peptidoglycan glycosyltransferase [Opitutae bacterium]|nr:peptidoglycan glycosyltransferase [Opitutae bacterium]
MSFQDSQRTARSGSMVEAHTTFQPRVFFFHFVIAVLLLVLIAGFAYQQLTKTSLYHEAERVQSQRRILVPGPRGNIYDREGRTLVGNRGRLSVILNLDELRAEFRREYLQIRKNYRDARDADKPDMPSSAQMWRIARAAVVQRYLDQVNAIIGREVRVDRAHLHRSFSQERLLPYTLIEDLAPQEYAQLIERLPVRSPLQVFSTNTREYPYGSAAAHTIGYVRIDSDPETDEATDDGLTTFKMKGSIGVNGLEKQFDHILQGEPGTSVFRVDPDGYRINPPLEKRLPRQGNKIVTSLDIDLQLAAEKCMEVEIQNPGAAVAIDVRTGEVLVLASKPDYNLNDFVPRISASTVADLNARRAWSNLALNGVFPPGSTFKLITAIAGLRAGVLTPESVYTTDNVYRVGKHPFRDHRGCVSGDIDFYLAVENSVNTYFIHYGLLLGPERIAAEARRFHLHEPTGIELPSEVTRMIVPDPAWKKKTKGESWFDGDTANLSFGQGYVEVTPLQMACFMASLARGETHTRPTLIHEENRPPQRSAPIGLSAENYRALIDGMELVVTGQHGSARGPGNVRGLRVAGKTGTAQREVQGGKIELAWFVGFAPVEQPEIAFAVLILGDTPDESYSGGRYAAPVARAILTKWLEKKQRGPATPPVQFNLRR